MDNEFVNAYIQRMLALNNDLTNKNVMLETRIVLLEKKYNELLEAYNVLQQAAMSTTVTEESNNSSEAQVVEHKKQEEQF